MSTTSISGQQWVDLVWARGYSLGWEMGSEGDDQLTIGKLMEIEGGFGKGIRPNWIPKGEFKVVENLLQMLPAAGPLVKPRTEGGKFVLHFVEQEFFQEAVGIIQREAEEGGHHRKELHAKFSEKIAEEALLDPTVLAIDHEIFVLTQRIDEANGRRNGIIRERVAELEAQREEFLFVADPNQSAPREL